MIKARSRIGLRAFLFVVGGDFSHYLNGNPQNLKRGIHDANRSIIRRAFPAGIPATGTSNQPHGSNCCRCILSEQTAANFARLGMFGKWCVKTYQDFRPLSVERSKQALCEIEWVIEFHFSA